MKDIETKSIFETYSKHKQRLSKLAYLRENFEDGANPFGKDSDEKADDDTEDTKDVSTDSSSTDDKDAGSSDTSKDSKSSDTSSSSSTSASSSSSSSKIKDDGKMTEEELDEEIDHLTAKKDKIKKLFEDESIDKEVAEQALDKIKQLTNQLISKFI
jgi:hypothetical protein